MDILRKSLAPISSDAWEAIEDQAREVLKTTLTARQFIDVEGPKGWEYSALPLGRLEMGKKPPKSNIEHGTYMVQPLIEMRRTFQLERWELDNLARGAKDIDLDPVVDAALELARFEEQVIFDGLTSAQIKGLIKSSAHKELKMPGSDEDLLTTVAKGVETLKASAISGPWTLVINPEKWQSLAASHKGYPLSKQITEIIGGRIITSPAVSGMLLVSERGEDFELTLGSDFSVGYENHDHEKITFFITESFTFRVLEPKAVLVYK